MKRSSIFARGCAIWRLRRRVDRPQVATVAIAFAGIYLPQCLAMPLWARPFWIIGTALMCFRAHVVIHNHMHVSLFRHRAGNVVFQVLAALARGHTVCDTLLPHIHNHHPLRGRPGDWVSPELAGEGRSAWSILRYIVVSTITMQWERRRLGVPEADFLPSAYRISRPWEKGLLMMAVAGSLIWNWKVFLGHQVLPWLVALAMLVAINLFQHERCDPDRPYGHSRNFTGAFLNGFCFNNGYHTVHHEQPGTHWSELPEAHRRTEPLMPSACQEPSFSHYLWRDFLRPNKSASASVEES
jgi:beta-carotene hydroxylase